MNDVASVVGGRDSSETLGLDELARMLPQYEMRGFLARGGMGAVYLGRQRALDRLVAIKILKPSWGTPEEFAGHFEFEAKALAKLHHTGIVSVHDFGATSNGLFYLVMDYVEGQTLQQLIKRRMLTPHKVKDLALQLCDAVGYAHAHGIQHRDLKPANIIVDEDGCAKVMDFGLARSSESEPESLSIGTAGYAAPELRQEGALVDHRADIYALGVVFHEMLTGSRIEEPRLPLSAFGQFDPFWGPAITKATAKLPRDRFATVHGLKDAIELVGCRSTMTAPLVRERKRPSAKSARTRSPWVPVMLSTSFAVAVMLWWQANYGSATESHDSTDGMHSSEHGENASTSTGPVLRADLLPGNFTALNGGHAGGIRDVVVMPDRKHVATCGEDGRVMLWSLETGARTGVFGPVGSGLHHLTASPDGRHLAACTGDGTVYLWAIGAEAEPVTKLSLGEAGISEIEFTPQGAAVLIATLDPARPLVRWDWGRAQTHDLKGWRTPVTSFAYLPDHRKESFVTSGSSSTDNGGPVEFRIGNLRALRADSELPNLTTAPDRMEVAPDGRTAVLFAHRQMEVVDLHHGAKITDVGPLPCEVKDCTFVDGGRLILTWGADGKLRLWETVTGREVWQSKTADTGVPEALAVSRNESFAVTGGAPKSGGTAPARTSCSPHIWKLPTMGGLHTVQGRRLDALTALLTMAVSDAELATRTGQWIAQCDAALVQAPAWALDNLEQNYVGNLRRELASAKPAERDAYLGEIARVRKHERPPAFSVPGWPVPLVKHFGDFVDKWSRIPLEAEDARKRITAAQSDQMQTMEQGRITAGDTAGAVRVALLQELVAPLHDGITWEKLRTAIRNALPPALSARAWAAAPCVPQNLVVPEMTGAPVLTRPSRQGRIAVWPRLDAPGPTASILFDAMPDTADAVAVSAGVNHALLLRAGGTVQAWGMRTGTERAVVPEGLDRVVAIAAGSRFDMALREDGSVVAWSAQACYKMPAGMKPAVSIHNGVMWGYARHADGTLTRIPADDANLAYANVPALDAPVETVSVGFSHAVALLRDGTVRTWGREAGTGGRLPAMPPDSNSRIISIAQNHFESAALRDDGELIILGEPWRIAKIIGRRLPGADRVQRSWPGGMFAVHFPEDRWEFISSNTVPGHAARYAAQACGCPDIAIGESCMVAIRAEGPKP